LTVQQYHKDIIDFCKTKKNIGQTISYCAVNVRRQMTIQKSTISDEGTALTAVESPKTHDHLLSLRFLTFQVK